MKKLKDLMKQLRKLVMSYQEVNSFVALKIKKYNKIITMNLLKNLIKLFQYLIKSMKRIIILMKMKMKRNIVIVNYQKHISKIQMTYILKEVVLEEVFNLVFNHMKKFIIKKNNVNRINMMKNMI